jgi:hypothetical protein
MRGVFGVVTLVLTGVIIANLATNSTGVVAGMNQLNIAMANAYAAMLGYNPLATYTQPGQVQTR